MKTSDEFKEEIFERAKKEKQKIKKRNRLILTLVPCIAVVLVLGICSLTFPRKSIKNIEENEDVSQTAPNYAAPKTIDLMENIKPISVDGKRADLRFINSFADVSFEIFKGAALKNSNTLISPVSVINSLALIENGAQKNALKEFENTFGLKRNELNLYLKSFNESITKDSLIQQTNSIWADSNRAVLNKDFLQANADYFNAGVFSIDFNNPKAPDEINSWIDKSTQGMIKNMVDEISKESVLYLLNTLTFEDVWEKEYSNYSFFDEKFTGYDGKEQIAEFMASNESDYIEMKNAQGFSKNYKSTIYSFVALLPNEGIDIFDFISSLSGKDFVNAVKNPQKDMMLNVMIPKFQYDCSINLRDTLINMGIKSAFNQNTKDFSHMGKTKTGDNLYLSEVLHKTHIELTENGTRAGAATLVELKAGAPANMQYIEIYLTRPFMYAIVDNETGLPIFMGLVLSL